MSEDEQSDDDFEDERENGNHIPAGGWTGVMFVKVFMFLILIGEERYSHDPNVLQLD